MFSLLYVKTKHLLYLYETEIKIVSILPQQAKNCVYQILLNKIKQGEKNNQLINLR